MSTLDELLHACDGVTVLHVERWVACGLLRPGATITTHSRSAHSCSSPE